MKTILAICLLTATFAFIPGADASNCDPTFTVCEGSYSYGSCDSNGYAYNYVSSYSAAGYYSVTTSCYAYGGWYESTGVYVVTFGPAGYNDHYWVGYSYFGSGGCYSDSFNALGYTETPLCDVAGAPPAVPAVLP